ncbi:MAG: thioesterase family protein [Bacteroidota bacterium]
MPDAPAFIYTLEVRWGDMDAFGHVNNSTYFTYFEQARIAWLGTLPEGDLGGSHGPVVAQAACTYKRPVRYPATLQIEVRVGALGRSRLPTTYVVRHDKAVVATGEALLVWVDLNTGRPRSLPDAIRTALTPPDADA